MDGEISENCIDRTYRIKKMLSKKSQLENRIQKDIVNGKEIMGVEGAFGDVPDCIGFIEGNKIEPEEGGTLIKFYGCDFLFKGYPDKVIVEGIGLAKALISAIPRRIISRSILMIFSLVLLYIFSKKKFYHYLYVYTSILYFHTIVKLDIPIERYNTSTRELRRAFEIAILKTSKKYGVNLDLSHISTDYHLLKPLKKDLWESLIHLSRFICFFLEYDNAYRFPLQDIFAEINKENVKKSIIKEVLRLIKIFQIRSDTKESGRPIYKVLELKWLLIGMLRINKQIRWFIKEFLLEVDINKVKMDENDWYFSLNRTGYDFKGLPYEERLTERKRIDKEKEHLKVQLMEMHIAGKPKEEIIKGLKVSYFDE